jgi:hypothetical protein
VATSLSRWRASRWVHALGWFVIGALAFFDALLVPVEWNPARVLAFRVALCVPLPAEEFAFDWKALAIAFVVGSAVTGFLAWGAWTALSRISRK